MFVARLKAIVFPTWIAVGVVVYLGVTELTESMVVTNQVHASFSSSLSRSSDPKRGSKVPIWLKNDGLVRRYVAVECDTCAAKSVLPLLNEKASKDKVTVLLLRASEDEIAHFRKAYRNLQFLATASGADLNPWFTPRVYIVDGAGRFLHIQQEPMSDSGLIKEVQK